MFARIIIALSLEHGYSLRAIQTARRLAIEGAEIHGVHVYEAPSGTVSTYLDAEVVTKAWNDAQARLAARLQDAPDVTPVMLKGHSSRSLVEYANETGADLIIAGSHKPGLSDYFLGTTAARLVRHAPCTVMVLR